MRAIINPARPVAREPDSPSYRSTTLKCSEMPLFATSSGHIGASDERDGDVMPTDQRIARVEISSLLSVQINGWPLQRSGTGRIRKVMGDRHTFDSTAPSPSGDILPSRVCRLIALGTLHERSVDENFRLAPARRRRPSESVGGGTRLIWPAPRADRSLSQRHEAGRDIGRLRRSAGFTEQGAV